MANFFNQITQCFLCKEQLVRPKRLKCLHVFCEECLKQYIEQFMGKPFITCPVCQSKTNPTSGGEVTRDFVSILEEDNFTTNFIRLLSTTCERDENTCTSHPGNTADKLCTDCCEKLCDICVSGNHSDCTVILISDNEELKRHSACNVTDTQAKLSEIQAGLNGVESLITPKLETLFNAKLDLVSKITTYYHDMKEVVSKYLADQERKLLHQLHDLADAELAHYQDDLTLCSSVKKSLAERSEVLSHNELCSANDVSDFAFQKYIAAQARDFNTVLQNLETDANKHFHVRFIVNENLEDKLKQLNLIQIELLSSSHRDPFAAFNDEDSAPEQRANDLATDSEISGTTQTQESRNTFQPCQGQLSNRHSPTQDQVQGPPPSYPNQGHHFRMRRANDRTTQPPLTRPVSNTQAAEPVMVSVTPPTPPVEPSAPALDDMGHLPSYEEYLASTTKFSQDLLEVKRTRAVSPKPSPPPSPTRRQQLTGFIPPHTMQAFDQPPISQPRNIRYHTILRMNYPTDKREPRIVGIARLSNTFIVADKWNNVLKVVGTDRRGIVDTLFLNAFQPWDIATMTDIKCLVTAPKQWSLLFVGFKDSYSSATLQVLGKLTTTKQYASVGYLQHKDEIVCGVCTPYGTPCIDILSSTGIPKTTYSRDASDGKLLFQYPRNIDTTERGDIVICDLDRKSVVFLNSFNGAFKTSSALEEGHMIDPLGVTVDQNGKLVFVLEAKQNKVMTFSYSGDLQQSFPQIIQHRDPKRIAVFFNSLAVVHGDGKVTFYNIE